jgi:hypothetical protein
LAIHLLLIGPIQQNGQASRQAFLILRELAGKASLFLGRRFLRAEAFGAWSAECFANNCKAVLASLPLKAETPTGPTESQIVQVSIPFSFPRCILLIQSVRIDWL